MLDRPGDGDDLASIALFASLIVVRVSLVIALVARVGWCSGDGGPGSRRRLRRRGLRRRGLLSSSGDGFSACLRRSGLRRRGFRRRGLLSSSGDGFSACLSRSGLAARVGGGSFFASKGHEDGLHVVNGDS